MRYITFISLLIFALGCIGTKHATMKPGKLNGTWMPVQQEISGKLLPKAAFENQQLIMNDSTYTVIAESIDKGIVRFKGDKLDIYGKEGVNAGRLFTAIYKVEKGQLTICYNLLGDSYPDAFETKSKPLLFLSIFNKEK